MPGVTGASFTLKAAGVDDIVRAPINGIQIIARGSAVLAAPTGLTATAGNSQVALTWNAAAGATSYNVYRSTTPGGEGATPLVAGVTSTSYTNTGLANGTAYYYKVAAVNGGGTSAQSTEANATPLSIPAGTYKIVNRLSTYALDDAGFGGAGTGLVQWPYNGGANQQWKLTPSGAYYTMQCVYNNLAAGVNGSTTAGANVVVEAVTGGNDQLWTIAKQADGYYTLAVKSTGQLADDSAQSTAAGSHIVQWPANSGTNQLGCS